MAQRILYGSLAILFLLAIFAADAFIAERCAMWPGPRIIMAVDPADPSTMNSTLVGSDSPPDWVRPVISLLAQGSLVPLLMLGVMLAGAVELNRLLRATATKPYSGFAFGAITFLLCATWIGSAMAPIGPSYYVRLHPIMPATVVVLVALGIWTVLRRKPTDSIRDASATLLLIVYLGLLPAFGLALRCGPRLSNGAGAWLLLAVLLITKFSDIGAYFTGRAVGRHKLIPSVSPAKSVEGMIGGLVASGILAFLLGELAASLGTFAPGSSVWDWFADWTHKLGHPNATRFFAQTFGFGVALSAAAQFGDLLESCFKRDAGIKDTGNVMPQFGGVLDLVDSPILAMPVAWFLLAVVWGVV